MTNVEEVPIVEAVMVEDEAGSLQTEEGSLQTPAPTLRITLTNQIVQPVKFVINLVMLPSNAISDLIMLTNTIDLAPSLPIIPHLPLSMTPLGTLTVQLPTISHMIYLSSTSHPNHIMAVNRYSLAMERVFPFKTLWSPTEPHVFASRSVDGTIAIWDARLGKSAAASFKAHNADVNVISWNRLASCMLASGSDDGTFSIRDLKLLKEGDSTVAHSAVVVSTAADGFNILMPSNIRTTLPSDGA